MAFTPEDALKLKDLEEQAELEKENQTRQKFEKTIGDVIDVKLLHELEWRKDLLSDPMQSLTLDEQDGLRKLSGLELSELHILPEESRRSWRPSLEVNRFSRKMSGCDTWRCTLKQYAILLTTRRCPTLNGSSSTI